MPTDSCVKTVTYFVLLPIVFPLWLTLPDTRKQSGEFQNSTNVLTLQAGEPEEEEAQPLDLSWPDTCRERITYVAFLPIIIPLWLTLPDTRKQSGCDKLELPQTVAPPSRCYHHHLTHMSHLCFILSVAPATTTKPHHFRDKAEIGWSSEYETFLSLKVDAAAPSVEYKPLKEKLH